MTNLTSPSSPAQPRKIHGHDVIAFMMESNHAFTRESLIAAIEDKFGPSTRFYTCSIEDLSAGQFVDFLAEREKLMPLDHGFVVDPSRVCQH